MDPGIGPARRVHAHRLARDLRERRLDRSLDAAGVGLELPAAEAAAVVLERELEPPHRRQLEPLRRQE